MKDIQTPEQAAALATPDEDSGKITYGSVMRAMEKIRKYSEEDHDDAVRVANLFVEGDARRIANLTPEELDGDPPVSYERAVEVVKANIGYMCGYYGPEMARFWNPAINTSHPVFGNALATPEGVSPEAAFEAGKQAAGK